MNGSEKQYLGRKFASIDRKLEALHDDVLVIKTERRMEHKLVAGMSGFIALITTIVVRIFWR